MPPALGNLVEPALSQASTSAAAPRPSLNTGIASARILATIAKRQVCLLDAPHNQRLPAATITGSKYTLDISGEFLVLSNQRLGTRTSTGKYLIRCLDVRPGILLHTEAFDNLHLRTQESKREKDKLSGEEFLGSRNFFHFPFSVAILRPFNIY